MSLAVFGAEYASAYDHLYQDKDYQGESDLIERVFELYGQGPTRSVLDLGCGTGGHAVPLAHRGYEVVGVDRSPDMLEIARTRASGAARFELGDVTDVRLGRTFDAVLMMFAVLGYQIGNVDVEAALQTARAHLRPGGVFMADMWYGPAVVAQRPSERVKVIDTPASQVIRVASGAIDVRRNVCLVRYRVWTISRGHLDTDVHEQHAMRYFFEPELELFLGRSGFQLARLGAFPDIDTPPSESTWNVTLVARAV